MSSSTNIAPTVRNLDVEWVRQQFPALRQRSFSFWPLRELPCCSTEASRSRVKRLAGTPMTRPSVNSRNTIRPSPQTRIAVGSVETAHSSSVVLMILVPIGI